jgi:hypothetical protein
VSRLSTFLVGLGGVAAVGVVLTSPAAASIFGEENVTLGQILIQLISAENELQDLNEAASTSVALADDLLETYRQVNAGIEELQSYTSGQFVDDLGTDFSRLYPDLAALPHASERLGGWQGTRSPSPWTAYEAITAVVADVSGPLREDLEAGRTSIDEELLLQSEAAGGFALSNTTDAAAVRFDEELAALAELYDREPSPGTAAMIGARTQLLLAAQQSHIMRLLARGVRSDGVDMALEAGARIQGRNVRATQKTDVRDFAAEALTPPRMMRFEPPRFWP